ncbi:hypothetical protein GINT2_000599 [Glugoides intestinalis]
MAYVLEKIGTSRCALDAAKLEIFTQKKFADLIYDSHTRGIDYYLARVHCKERDGRSGNNIYYCYDAKQLCKHVFEMVITAEGRKIRIKNFKDPVNQREMSEINFFKLRHGSETPLKAEFIGNHVSFLESNNFRSKLFSQEDPLDALSVNFQFKKLEQVTSLKKKKIIDTIVVITIFLFVLLIVLVALKNIPTLGSKHVASIDKK